MRLRQIRERFHLTFRSLMYNKLEPHLYFPEKCNILHKKRNILHKEKFINFNVYHII